MWFLQHRPGTGVGSESQVPVSLDDPLPTQATAATYFNETTTPLGISATFTGAARDAGVSPSLFDYFNAFFTADQAGTASIEASNDGITFYTVASQALAINTPLYLQVPVTTRYHRAKLANGATGETVLKINSSYGVA